MNDSARRKTDTAISDIGEFLRRTVEMEKSS